MMVKIMSMLVSMDNLGQGRTQVQGVPEGLQRGSPSVVDHLLESGQMKVLVPAGGFLCVLPLATDFGFRGLGFTRN